MVMMRPRWGGPILLVILLGTLAYALAEDLTLTTYYPSPRGIYQSLRTTNDLTVGTRVSKGVLTVAGETVHTEFSECPAGYDWYDENGNGVKDFEGECKRTGLLITPAGTAMQVPRVSVTNDLQDVTPRVEGMLAYDLEAHQLKVYDGTNWKTAGATSHGIQLFDTSGSFLVPDGVTSIDVELWGGGGGGGHACHTSSTSGPAGFGGGGGGGGGYGRGQVSVTPRAVYSVAVGAVGPSARCMQSSICQPEDGYAGGESNVKPSGVGTSLIYASGGQGGKSAVAGSAGGSGGTSNGTVNLSGQNGGNGGSTTTQPNCPGSPVYGAGGRGGSAPNGGAGAEASCAASVSGNPVGGGASGCSATGAGSGFDKTGGPGRVIISW